MSNHQSPFQQSEVNDPRQQEVVQLLKQVIEQTLKNDIVSLGMVRNLRIVDDYVYLRLYIGSHQQQLQTDIQSKLSFLTWCKKTYIQICTIPGVKITLAVSSGKGGVGKSTTAVNIAAALSLQGAKVGILDADIYGPNVPQMLGLGQADIQVIHTPTGDKFLPLEVQGIKLMSVGLLVEENRPLAWRGPVLHKIITQFLQDVEWGELDYLLIDLPPGTGDAQITIIQESPVCGVILVTTPQEVAVADVRRNIYMFRQVGVPVLGIVENMSYLICGDCGARTPIFGSGGGEKLAAELQAPLLGKIPIDPDICSGGDTGNPIAISVGEASRRHRTSPASEVFVQIATALNATFSNSKFVLS